MHRIRRGKEETMKSHIRIPKCVLKRFEDENNFLFILDTEKNTINRGHAKSVNTQVDYYSEKVEAQLNEEIETPLGKILQEIEQIELSDPKFSLTEEQWNVIKQYTYALLARSKRLHELITEKRKFSYLHSEESNHDSAFLISQDILLGKNEFGEHFITLLNNFTNIPFVLPLCGSYKVGFGGTEMTCLPIMPKVAIVLVEKQLEAHFLKNEKICFIKLDKEEDALFLNRVALQAAKSDGCNRVVSNSQEILCRMKHECTTC